MPIESHAHVGNLTARDIMLRGRRCCIHMQADLHAKPCLGHAPLIASDCEPAGSLGPAVSQHRIQYCTGARTEDRDKAARL